LAADAAEFTFKCGGLPPDGHPMAIRTREAMQLSWRISAPDSIRRRQCDKEVDRKTRAC
jgi:hypothetical protein